MHSVDRTRRFLVTGGAGFIGSHLVSGLLTRGAEVVVLDDLSSGRRANLEAAVVEAEQNPPETSAGEAPSPPAERLTVIESSLLDGAALINAVDGVEAVLHQAAIPSVPRSFADPGATMRANAEGTTALLEACRKAGVRRVSVASSSSVYGNTPTLPKVESMPASPMSPYALSKLSAEYAGSIFAQTYGLEVFALRYFNIFGPRQDPTSEYAAVIPRFINALRAGDQPVVFGDGEQSRDFTYIDNVVHANLLAVGMHDGAGVGPSPPGAEHPGGAARATGDGTDGATNPAGGAFHALNIGCGARTTLLDLIAAINQIMGTDLEPRHVEPRPGDVRHSHADIDRARHVLGYEPVVDFEEGLRRTVEFFASVAVSTA